MNDELHAAAESAGRAALRSTYDAALAQRDEQAEALRDARDDATARATSAETARDAALTEVSAAKLTLAERDTLIAQLRAQIADLQAGSKVRRPTGDRYVAIEDLGVPVTAAGIQQAVMLGTRVKDKIITLPPGEFRFDGFGMGKDRFVAGVQVNTDTNPNAPLGLSGSVDAVTGAPLTGLGMVPGSSQFKTEAAAYQPGTSAAGQVYSQSQQAVVRFFKRAGATMENLVLLQADMPHCYHGFKLEGGTSGHTFRNVVVDGGNRGGGNMPPGETYSLITDGSGYTIEKVRHHGKGFTSTAIGVLSSAGGTISDVQVEDLRSGFAVVYWNCTGSHRANGLEGRRLGTGTGGMNGSLINFEGCQGEYTVTAPGIELDNAWPNPKLASGARSNPASGFTPRHEGKFPHVIVLDGGFDNNRAPKITILEPRWVGGFGFKGAFGIFRENLPNAVVKVILDGKEASPVYRPQWWVEPVGFTNPRTQYQVCDEAASSSPWG